MIGSQVSLRIFPHVTQLLKILGHQQLCSRTRARFGSEQEGSIAVASSAFFNKGVEEPNVGRF